MEQICNFATDLDFIYPITERSERETNLVSKWKWNVSLYVILITKQNEPRKKKAKPGFECAPTGRQNNRRQMAIKWKLQLWKLCGKQVMSSRGIWAVAAAPISTAPFSSGFLAGAAATPICTIKTASVFEANWTHINWRTRRAKTMRWEKHKQNSSGGKALRKTDDEENTHRAQKWKVHLKQKYNPIFVWTNKN